MRKIILITCIAVMALLLTTVGVFASSYNRTNAANYAATWAHARNSNYPNYGSGCDCTDCTNYLSQALNNGGYPLRTGSWNKDSYFEWWYRSPGSANDNSKTWSATDWFNVYVTQYPSEFQYISPSPSNFSKGDFFLLDLNGDGQPDHARFVMGNGYTSTNQADYTDGCGGNYSVPSQTYTLLVDQHCVDRANVAWDYRLPGGNIFWAYHVIW